MPSSIAGHIPFVISHVQRCDPKSILDVGIGWGKWGALCREYLDVWQRRIDRAEWQVAIHGIEIHRPYVHQGSIFQYDSIYVGDATAEVPRLRDMGLRFDCVLAMDMIEHQKPGAAAKLLRDCILLARKRCIVAIPLGEAWLEGNRKFAEQVSPYEAHRSAWTQAMVEDTIPTRILDQKIVQVPRGPVGCYVIEGGAK